MEGGGTNVNETFQQEEANSLREIKQHKETNDADQKAQEQDEHLTAPELDYLLADINQKEGGGMNALTTFQQ